MHCTESRAGRACRRDAARPPAAVAVVVVLVAALFAGCATQAPVSPQGAPPVAPGAATGPARPAEPIETPLPPRTGAPALPAPAAARNWVEFKTNAGRRLVAASPRGSYLGEPPSVLFGIPVIETELYVDGTIKSIRVVREPTNPAARDTVQIAIAAIRRAAPYGDMTRLSRPWKWVEAFLFDDRRHFKPQSLDE